MKHSTQLLIIIFLGFGFIACSWQKSSTPSKIQTIEISTNNASPFTISFEKGASFNHPTFSFWIEDMNENFISTIYVTQSLANSTYAKGHLQGNVWSVDSGKAIRPATLPVWLHKTTNNNIAAINVNKKLVPDAYSGATPKENFALRYNMEPQIPRKFRLVMEINQAWDWNEYWTNNKYPDSFEYKTSCQPSVIYSVTVDLDSDTKEFYLNPIGHGHYAGENGKIFTDLSTLTTALQIVKQVKVLVN